MLVGQQLVLKGRGFRPSVQGQGLKRGGRDGGTFRKMVSILLKRGNIAHIVILVNVRFHFRFPLWRFWDWELQKVCLWLKKTGRFRAKAPSCGRIQYYNWRVIFWTTLLICHTAIKYKYLVKSKSLRYTLKISVAIKLQNKDRKFDFNQLNVQQRCKSPKGTVHVLPQICHLLVTHFFLGENKSRVSNHHCVNIQTKLHCKQSTQILGTLTR